MYGKRICVPKENDNHVTNDYIDPQAYPTYEDNGNQEGGLNLDTLSDDDIRALNFEDPAVQKQFQIDPFPIYDQFDEAEQYREYRHYYMKTMITCNILWFYREKALLRLEELNRINTGKKIGKKYKSSHNKKKTGKHMNKPTHHKDNRNTKGELNLYTATYNDINELNPDDPIIIKQFGIDPFPIYDTLDKSGQYLAYTKYSKKLFCMTEILNMNREKAFNKLKELNQYMSTKNT
jgi:hypothetical protein